MADETVVEQVQQTVTTQPIVVTQSSFGTPLSQVIDTPAPAEVTEPTIDAPNQETTNVEQTIIEPKENEAAVFNVPTFGEQPIATTENTETSNNNQPQTEKDWKEVLKTVDRTEALKLLGLDEFDIQFADYRKTGNDPMDYLKAKAVNYDNVTDVDIIRQDIKEQYPNLSDADVERLVNRKYSLSSDDDDEREDGLLMLKTDAYAKRQAKKEAQKNFVIPTVEKPQEAGNKQYELQQQQIEQQTQQRLQEYQRMIDEHESTKKLLESKRVTVELGEGVQPFNFPIDNPQSLLSVAFGKNWSRAIAINPQEADESKLIPDIAKLQKIAYIAMNPNYEKDIFNYGKSQGLKALVDEGQNARKPDGHTPNMTTMTINEVIKNGGVKQSTFGSN